MIWFILLTMMLVIIILHIIFKTTKLTIIMQLVISSALVSVVYYSDYYLPNNEYQIMNGYVTNKSVTYVPKNTEYKCNCSLMLFPSGETENICDLCEKSNSGYNYQVETSIGSISLYNGDNEKYAERFNSVQIGEPISMYVHTDNSFRRIGDYIYRYIGTLSTHENVPVYPVIYDYYRFDRVINMTNVDVTGWEDYVDEKIKYLSKNKLINIIVVITDEPKGYFSELESAWAGGKRNDFIIAFGVKGDKVEWVESTKFADNSSNNNVTAIYEKSHGKTLELNLLKEELDQIQREFIRSPAREFVYLTSKYGKISTVMHTTSLFIGILTPILVLYLKRKIQRFVSAKGDR